MALIRFAEKPNFRNPWAEFERIRQGLDELSRNFGDRDQVFGRASVFPPINMSEESDHLTIKAEMPGVPIEELSLSIEGDTLNIEGKRPASHQGGDKVSYHRREIESGSFSRAVTLPTKIDPDQVRAKMQNGILVITLPKAAEVKPRQINVAVA